MLLDPASLQSASSSVGLGFVAWASLTSGGGQSGEVDKEGFLESWPSGSDDSVVGLSREHF